MTRTENYADLQLRIAPALGQRYSVEPQFSQPGTDAEIELDPGQAQFDFDALTSLQNDIDAYADLLTHELFADPKTVTCFQSARRTADSLHTPLRLRLFIDPRAPELHALRWETLRDPCGDGSLVTSERILFSRYLRSPDWRPVKQHMRSELRALVLVANPANLAEYAPDGLPLQPLKAGVELELAQKALHDIPVTPLVGAGLATLDALTDHLREGYDIVYLVCHGALLSAAHRDRALLYLEDASGGVAVVTGSELAERLAELRTLPGLIVLAACQTAGGTEGGALAAVGPVLARVGVPAVVAMQGQISVATSDTFMQRFFVELGRDGQIDRAVAVARAQVRQRPDAWMPVLFTRLRSGLLWTEWGPEAGSSQLSQWGALIHNIRDGTCTPILGPGLIEFLLGSHREIAQRWADTYRFPMAPHERQDLPQVAQYLAVNQSEAEFPRAELRDYLAHEMRERYGSQLPDSLRQAPIEDLVAEIGRQRREREPNDPFEILARLPLHIYVTTNPDDLLSDALAAEGRQPIIELCRWNDELDWPPSIMDTEPDYRPTADRPLVYHLFGRFRLRNSVVLTEDDYFDYLIGVTRNGARKVIPLPVVRAWSDSSLLFLGFQVDAWNFRVLFHSIMKQEGRERRRRKPHVAVQIDPEQGGSIDPERARRYLDQYFGGENIHVYWGSTEQFLRELWDQWQAKKEREWQA